MSRARGCVPSSLALLLALSPVAAPAQSTPAPATVRVGYFSSSLPLLAAQYEGFFADEGLTVAFTQVRSSIGMFSALRDGLMDVAFSSPDNPVNYRLNPSNAIGTALDVQMLLGTDRGLDLSLVARPQLATVESLRGARIGVDAVDSGYAFVLYAILAQHGLQRGVDYQVVIVGGTPLRLAALEKAPTAPGAIDATLLNSDSYVRAVAAGFQVLAPVSAVASPYLGGVASARQSWLDANPDVAVRFVRAYYRGHTWAMDPANHDAAIALLASYVPNTTPALAEQIYDVLLDPTGLIPYARLDRKGLYQVVLLRDEMGGFEQPENLRWLVTPASGIYDLSWYRMAVLRDGDDDPGEAIGSDPTYVEQLDPVTDHTGHGEDADGDVAGP